MSDQVDIQVIQIQYVVKLNVFDGKKWQFFICKISLIYGGNFLMSGEQLICTGIYFVLMFGHKTWLSQVCLHMSDTFSEYKS